MNLVIPWDTRDVSPGDYRISAYASVVPGETHVEDNMFSDGVVSLLAHDVVVVDVTPYIALGLSRTERERQRRG